MNLDRTPSSPNGTKTTITDGRAVLQRALHHEVCPLCLSRYAPAEERICVSCEAPSCPDCAEQMPGSEGMLCFACPVPTKH